MAAVDDIEYERIASRAGQAALDRQAEILGELRSRAGAVLASASLSGSFLAARVEDTPPAVVTIASFAAFAACIAASVYILLPKEERFVFGFSAPDLYERFYSSRDDLGEVHRRLAYGLAGLWEANDLELARLSAAFQISALALVTEIGLLLATLTGTLI